MTECPHCGSNRVEYSGRIECDDEVSLEIFCDEYYCNACNKHSIGGMSSDADEFEDDGYDD